MLDKTQTESNILMLKEHLCDLIKQRICQVDVKLLANEVTCSVQIYHGVVINEGTKIGCEKEIHCLKSVVGFVLLKSVRPSQSEGNLPQ